MKTDVVSPAQVTVALMRGSVATGEVVDAGIGAAVDLRWVQGAAVGADVGATPGAAVEATRCAQPQHGDSYEGPDSLQTRRCS